MRATLHRLAGLAMLLSVPVLIVLVGVTAMSIATVDSGAEAVTLGGVGPSEVIGLWLVIYTALAVVWFATDEAPQGRER